MTGAPRPDLVLASGSKFRQSMLNSAGVDFRSHPASIDERVVEAPLLEAGTDAADIALVLAMAKADDVSQLFPGAIIIGADQTLSFENELLHKAGSIDEARRRLIAMSGRAHELHSAVTLVRDGESLWSHVETCHMTMRDFDPAFVGRYAAQMGDALLESVGAYQIEGLGAQLFDRIEGDFFSIIGLPLLPLLAQLRKLELMDS